MRKEKGHRYFELHDQLYRPYVAYYDNGKQRGVIEHLQVTEIDDKLQRVVLTDVTSGKIQYGGLEYSDYSGFFFGRREAVDSLSSKGVICEDCFDNIIDSKIFDKFIQLYGDTLLEKYEGLRHIKIQVHNVSTYKKLEPYLTLKIDDIDNSHFSCFMGESCYDEEKTFSGIVINERLVSEFTEEEQYAAIAHEIGHVIFHFFIDAGDSQQEFFADAVAKELGLKESMMSVLNKLIGCDSLSDVQKECLEIRKLYLNKDFGKKP